MPNNQVWFITGSSSGIGRAMTELVLSEGDRVVATCRKPAVLDSLVQKYPKYQLLVVALDVTQAGTIKNAFAEAVGKFGKVDVVFNNAGYTLLGEVESTPDAMARAVFEADFWGSANVAREAVRVFRDENKPQGGRLLTITSIVGIVASAALGYYTAAKHATEGLLEALSKEVDPAWNIKITNIAPGGFRTRGAQAESLVQSPEHPAYSNPDLSASKMRKLIPGVVPPGDADKAMKVIYHQVAMFENPPMHFPLGKDAIFNFRRQAQRFTDDAARYESLSDDLLHDDGKLMTHLEEQEQK